MKYLETILKTGLVLCVLCGMAGLVLAKGTTDVTCDTVNEMNALIAAVVMALVGAIIFVQRRRDQ